MASSPSSVQSKNLFSNYVSLLGGTVFAKGLGLVTVLLLTRYLGVEGFGQYSLAFSFWALLNTLVDLGGSHIASRDIAKTPENPRPLLESIIYLRLIGCALFLPFGFMLGEWLGLSSALVWMVVLGIFIGFEAYYDVYFSATMQLDKAAKARFAASVANVLLIGVAVWLKWSLVVIVLLAMLNPLLKLAWDYGFSRFKIRLHAPNWRQIGQLLRDGWPLWFGGIQFIILSRVDTLMLQVLATDGPYEVGIYSAAYRFSEVMALLINSLCPALLPLLVRNKADTAHMHFLAGTGIRLILTLLLALSLLIFWYAPWITQLYGPGYGPAADCMRILVGSQPFLAVNALCYYLLLVYNAQVKRPIIVFNVLVTLLNVGLNYWLIPIFQAQGASWATVLCEAALLVGLLSFLRLYTPIRLGKHILQLGGLTLISCIPVILLGSLYGLLSSVLLVGLVFGLRLLTVPNLKRLAQEKLQISPENPT